MSFERPLRGSCSCGRNRYIIEPPKDAGHVARVLFDSHPLHRASQASPLSAFLRVPLSWYHSTTHSFFPDETSAMIRRAYTSPRETHARRQFCGFCGTPLSYWSEEPRTEADFIQLALGSLIPEDLADLEDLGLLPDSSSDEGDETAQPGTSKQGGAQARAGTDDDEGQEVEVYTGGHNLPWFDTLTAGSRLGGRLRAAKGARQSRDGTQRVEWEIVEWTSAKGATNGNGKRKLSQHDETGEGTRIQAVRQ